MSNIDIQNIAEEFDVNQHSLQSLTDYCMNRLQTEEQREMFKKYPEKVMKILVEGWLKSSTQFFNAVLIEGSEERQFLLDSIANNHQP